MSRTVPAFLLDRFTCLAEFFCTCRNWLNYHVVCVFLNSTMVQYQRMNYLEDLQCEQLLPFDFQIALTFELLPLYEEASV